MVSIVEAQELQRWLQNGDVLLVDVRELEEYAQEHIKEANLIPLSIFAMHGLGGIEPGGKRVVFQCKSGGRSHAACEMFVKMRPSVESWNLIGGIQAWKAAGFPVESGH